VNLARARGDFSTTLEPVLEALEEQMVLLRLLSEQSGDSGDPVSVMIGRENSAEGLASASVVTAGYGNTSQIARLGIVGPTRMDYPATMGAVRAVAHYVGRMIDTT